MQSGTPTGPSGALPLASRPRVTAALIDAVTLFVAGQLLFPFGLVACTVYLVVAARTRTFGQRAMRLRTLSLDTDRSPRFSQGFVRMMPWHALLALENFPVSAFVLWAVIVYAAIFAVTEGWLARRCEWSYGLGDLMAGTYTHRA